jgi:hypothetical protein
MQRVLHPPADIFPVGTSVSAYRASQRSAAVGAPGAAPADTKSVQADGSLTFVVAPGQYVAYANVGGVDRYINFGANIGQSNGEMRAQDEGWRKWFARGWRVFEALMHPEGVDQRMGQVTLVAGSATFTITPTSDRPLSASSRIFLSRATLGGAAGNLSYAINTATGVVTITSSSGTDTSVINYLVIEAA